MLTVVKFSQSVILTFECLRCKVLAVTVAIIWIHSVDLYDTIYYKNTTFISATSKQCVCTSGVMWVWISVWMTSSTVICRILLSFMYAKIVCFVQKYIQLFIHLTYCVENDDKHTTNCSRLNTLGLINTEHAHFETTLSCHH